MGVEVGFHKGCGGIVEMTTYPRFRTGNWERFAEPDEVEYRCIECGEWLESDEVVDTYSEAMPDEEEDDEDCDYCEEAE